MYALLYALAFLSLAASLRPSFRPVGSRGRFHLQAEGFKRSNDVKDFVVDESQILKRIDSWACIKDCGACCKLGPLDSRPDLEEYLTKPGEFELYKSMIGEDDYCIHFDREKKMCTVYEERPDFCVVKPSKMKEMFGVEEEEASDFCSFCCREQIGDAYGDESDVMERFEDIMAALQVEEEGKEEERRRAEKAEKEKDFGLTQEELSQKYKEGWVDPEGGRYISIDIDGRDYGALDDDDDDDM